MLRVDLKFFVKIRGIIIIIILIIIIITIIIINMQNLKSLLIGKKPLISELSTLF